jgi:phosphatidylglycerophosphate synthase
VSEIKPHKRVNDILLGPLERPALKWMAAHSPAWVTPDMMSALGMIGGLMILLGYGLSQANRNFLWLAILGFVINWVGDSLDGTLARYRHIERPRYGYFLDHTLDAVCQIMVFFGLGISPYIDLRVALLCLVAYMLLSVLVYVRTYVVGHFQLSYGKLGPTEVRVVAILLTLWMYFGGLTPFGVTWQLHPSVEINVYDALVLLVAALLVYFFASSWLAQARELAKLEPPHKPTVES